MAAQVNKLEITSDKQFLAAAGNPSIKIFEVKIWHSLQHEILFHALWYSPVRC